MPPLKTMLSRLSGGSTTRTNPPNSPNSPLSDQCTAYRTRQGGSSLLSQYFGRGNLFVCKSVSPAAISLISQSNLRELVITPHQFETEFVLVLQDEWPFYSGLSRLIAAATKNHTAYQRAVQHCLQNS